MFVLMLFGMVSSVLNAAIKNRRMEMAKARREGKATTIGLKIDKWDMFQPLLFSMITFSVLYTQVGEGSLNVGNAALSFETGFVWHTIVGRQLREPNNR